MYLEADLSKVPATQTIHLYTDLAKYQTTGTEYDNVF